MGKKVLVTKTKSGSHYKIVSKARDGQPIMTPLFEATDDNKGQERAVKWAQEAGYEVD